MKTNFVVNIIHRPELSPEYAEKSSGVKESSVQDESLEIFKFQQETAHKNGLKTTIQITYASLFSDVIVKLAKEHHEKYGDEIGLSLLGLPCKEFRQKYKTEDFCIWMFSDKQKEEIVDDVFKMFYDKFGFYPESTGSYFMDAYTINYIKKKYPSVKCAIATCWEEGPKAYHTCNNSWYTFMDGGTPSWMVVHGILGFLVRLILTAQHLVKKMIVVLSQFRTYHVTYSPALMVMVPILEPIHKMS